MKNETSKLLQTKRYRIWVKITLRLAGCKSNTERKKSNWKHWDNKKQNRKIYSTRGRCHQNKNPKHSQWKTANIDTVQVNWLPTLHYDNICNFTSHRNNVVKDGKTTTEIFCSIIWITMQTSPWKIVVMILKYKDIVSILHAYFFATHQCFKQSLVAQCG